MKYSWKGEGGAILVPLIKDSNKVTPDLADDIKAMKIFPSYVSSSAIRSQITEYRNDPEKYLRKIGKATTDNDAIKEEYDELKRAFTELKQAYEVLKIKCNRYRDAIIDGSDGAVQGMYGDYLHFDYRPIRPAAINNDPEEYYAKVDYFKERNVYK